MAWFTSHQDGCVVRPRGALELQPLRSIILTGDNLNTPPLPHNPATRTSLYRDFSQNRNELTFVFSLTSRSAGAYNEGLH